MRSDSGERQGEKRGLKGLGWGLEDSVPKEGPTGKGTFS